MFRLPFLKWMQGGQRERDEAQITTNRRSVTFFSVQDGIILITLEVEVHCIITCKIFYIKCIHLAIHVKMTVMVCGSSTDRRANLVESNVWVR